MQEISAARAKNFEIVTKWCFCWHGETLKFWAYVLSIYTNLQIVTNEVDFLDSCSGIISLWVHFW